MHCTRDPPYGLQETRVPLFPTEGLTRRILAISDQTISNAGLPLGVASPPPSPAMCSNPITVLSIISYIVIYCI